MKTGTSPEAKLPPSPFTFQLSQTRDTSTGDTDNLTILRQELHEKYAERLTEEKVSSVALPLAMRQLRERSIAAASEQVEAARSRGVVAALPETTPSVQLHQAEVELLATSGFRRYTRLTEANEFSVPCQDVVRCFHSRDLIVGVVADGVGQCPLAHVGARLLAQRAGESALQTFGDQPSVVRPELHAALYTNLYTYSHELAARAGVSAETAMDLFLATTLQVAVFTPKECILLVLGDGFFEKGGALQSIEEAIGRPQDLCERGHPQLLKHVLRTDLKLKGHTWNSYLEGYLEYLESRSLSGEEFKAKLQRQQQFRRYHEEASAFSIAHYGATADFLNTTFLHYSDGVRFCSASLGCPERDERGEVLFPRSYLTANSAYKEEAIMLWNLLSLPCELEQPHQRIAMVECMLRSCPVTEGANSPLLNAVQSAIAIIYGESPEDPASVADVVGALSMQGREPSAEPKSEVMKFIEALQREARGELCQLLGSAPGSESVIPQLQAQCAVAPLWDDFSFFRLSL